jgi:hypothetical protein
MAKVGDSILLYGPYFDVPTTTWVPIFFRFQAGTWTDLELSKPPPHRQNPSLATLGDSVVLFGGMNHAGVGRNDTWVWKDGVWTEVKPPVSPPARALATLTSYGDKVVLFGGSTSLGDSSGSLADTWTFDGKTWTQVVTPTSPPPRFQHVAGRFGDLIVMTGGRPESGATYGDTWVFDGVTWASLPGLSPPAVSGAMAPSKNGKAVVYFGGYDNDLWYFDGGWHKAVTPLTPRPPQRIYGGLVTLP